LAPGLTIVDKGHGPGVVLVHGMLGDYRQWTPIADRLKGYRVLAVSRRYHYPDSPPPRDAVYSYDSHRDDLLEALRAVGEPVHLVGHSYGAGVTLLAALSEPKRIRSLTLIEPALGSVVPATTPGLGSELSSRNAMFDAVRALAAAGEDERAAETLTDWIQGGAGEFGKLPEAVRAGLLQNAATLGPTLSTAAPNVTCDALRQLLRPALVLNGENTRLWYRLIGASTADCIPEAVSAKISASRHMAIVENPEQAAWLLMEFLSKH
jgi:pimeloyl-ACP methyl ester carboxylesterase